MEIEIKVKIWDCLTKLRKLVNWRKIWCNPTYGMPCALGVFMMTGVQMMTGVDDDGCVDVGNSDEVQLVQCDVVSGG